MKQSDLAAQSKPFSKAALSTVTLVLIAGCALFQQRPVTPISVVIESAQNGASEQQLVTEIRNARTIYAMRGSDFPRLAELGVPEAALDELQQSFFADVEFLTRRWFSRGGSGGPTSNFPQPLDLDSLSEGGNGMGPTANLGQITHGSRPQGVPQWVPPFPPLTGPTMPANAVVEMTNSGMPTEEIVETVLGSRVDILYAPSGALSSRFRTAALTGSMFARFAEQGVAPEVLDALQAVFISQHVERSRNTGSRGTGGANR